MSFDELKIKFENFKDFDWRAIAAQSDQEVCVFYSLKFSSAEKQAEGEGQAELCAFFAAIMDFTFTASEPDEPFTTSYEMGGRRGVIPSDLKEEHFVFIEKVIGEIDDPEIKARFADVLWLCKRGFKNALVAIDAYVDTATVLKDHEHWNYSTERLERAFRIARQVGNAEYFDKVSALVKSWIDEKHGKETSFQCHKLISLVTEFEPSSTAAYADIVKGIGDRMGGEGQEHLQADYYELEVSLRGGSGDPAVLIEAAWRKANVHFSRAKKFTEADPPSYIGASHEAETGLEVLKKAGVEKEERDKKQVWLHELQKNIAGEMKTMASGTVDLTAWAESARDAVNEKPLLDALKTLAMHFNTLDPDKIKAQVLKQGEQFSFRRLVSSSLVDGDGRRIARHEDSMAEDEETREKALEQDVFGETGHYRHFHALGYIEPGRRLIHSQNPSSINDLLELTRNNPFVPPGRELSYAKGLLYGLRGEFMESTSILIPQVENSVRHVLVQSGHVATSILDDGRQEQFDLNKTLRMAETEKVLGKSMTFDLRGLLVERFGSNLRNSQAHGLIGDREFGSVESVYLWWLVLRLISIPLIAVDSVEKTKAEDDSDEGEGNSPK